MQRTDTLIIGAGQAGLALSHELSRRGRDHVVVDRGRLGERWRSERRAGLRLLTPNWMTRLPGFRYSGGDPDGFMTAAELVAHLEVWAASFAAPVVGDCPVRSVAPAAGGGYDVLTEAGAWRAAQVVVATGHAQQPAVPDAASRLAASVHQLVPPRYRGPGELPPGGVLVVGASATGVQIAEELARSGRRTVLAVGRHTRLPRRYRGMDILWWLDRMGILDVDADEVRDLERARRQPSWQLVGRPARDDIDLATVSRLGVELAGRVADVDGHRVHFAPDLAATVAAADAALARLLDRVDAHIEASGLAAEVLAPDRPAPIAAAPGPAALDLHKAGISTVVWATGYRRRYPWLHVPVLDRSGDILQHRGVTASPGLYTVGMRFQTRRNSSFIDGAGHDARAVADHLAGRAPEGPLSPSLGPGGDR